MRCYYLMTKWRCDNVTVYIIFAGHEYTANKFDHRSFKEAFFPGAGIVYQSLFLEKTRLDLRKRWRSRGGGRGGGEEIKRTLSPLLKRIGTQRIHASDTSFALKDTTR